MTESLSSQLAHFHGSDTIYRNPFMSLLYTEGAKQLAEIAEAYWLLDVVGSHLPKMERDPEIWAFSLWTLKLNTTNGCTITCQADSGRENFIIQEVPYTTFPENYSWYVCDGTMMLKSEY